MNKKKEIDRATMKKNPNKKNILGYLKIYRPAPSFFPNKQNVSFKILQWHIKKIRNAIREVLELSWGYTVN